MNIKVNEYITSLILILIVQSSCSVYNEEINFRVQNFETITPSTIDTDLKIINLEVDPVEFEAMYKDYEDEIEIDAVFNLYKNGETLIQNQAAEIEVKGSFSAAFELKSLGVKFDKAFDNSNRELIDVETLPFHSIDKIKSFRLRNSGNDFRYTMLKDMSLSRLAVKAELDLEVMYSEQAVVFLNNSFLGLMNIRTEVNGHGLSRLYEKKRDDITLASLSAGGVIEKKDGDFERIDLFFQAISDQNTEYLLDEIDHSNFIDYVIFETYIGNIDWPLNNVRILSIDEQPFRFVLFDMDLAILQRTNIPPLDFILAPKNDEEPNPISSLFKLMYENQEFKERYDERFEELVKSGLLSYSVFNEIVDLYKINIQDLIPTQVDKYGFPKSMTEWIIEMDRLKYNFSKREETALKVLELN